MGEVDLPLSGQLNPVQPTHFKRRATEAAAEAPSKMAKSGMLSSREDLLAAELAQ